MGRALQTARRSASPSPQWGTHPSRRSRHHAQVLRMPCRHSSRRGCGRTGSPPKTPWGHPDIQGNFTTKDEANTPFERPDEWAGRSITDITSTEFEAAIVKRQERAIERAPFAGGGEPSRASPLRCRFIGSTTWRPRTAARGSSSTRSTAGFPP